ncbi:Ig-like domain-containing protein [Hufsiella ginkgonis]|uniref:SbsA Ig-like domain-containing protein n=1 Tax=Hufsiella ginkgonis TaxID=2695274 RepID=A0A7K1XV95_9SPHI|nr:Ig-like domain-containing protein [Hufsiella ginkgonis]MXV14718.1 hypothetical protein [Hufsiella ginkgonis]
MANFQRDNLELNLFIAFFLIISFLAACASIQQPTGGARDRTPPKILKEYPKNLSLNFSAKKIEITFDEYFKLANESKEISISPALDKNPIFKTKGKTLVIDLQDTLERNTTYTINFGKAIVDYNEGNILKNYSYVFATGNVIDSLSISGTVYNAVTKKPEMETTVLLIPIKQDTIFGKRPANIFSITDSSGNFSLKNLRGNTYKIYALKEQGGDRIYNSTNELIGFRKDSIVLKENITGIKLEVFKEDPVNFRMDRKMQPDGHYLFTFNYPLKKPSVTLLKQPELDRTKFAEFNKPGDSLNLWLPKITYDTLDVAFYDQGKGLDTITLRRNEKDKYNYTVNISDNVENGKIRQRRDIYLTLSAPISAVDDSKISVLEDSIPLANVEFNKDTSSIRRYSLKYNWRNKKKYVLKIEENAFTSINGGKNKAYKKDFIMDPDLNYGDLIFNTRLPDSISSSFIVQLIKNEKDIVRTSIVTKSSNITFAGLAPDSYTVRVIYDTNNNGKWDTGKVKEKLQPEMIWNYDKTMTVLANRDLEEPLTIPKTP